MVRKRRAVRRDRRQRAPVAFVSWGAVAGRSVEIAEALGGKAYAIFPPTAARRPRPSVRYAISSLLTVAYLVREEPGAVVTTNPPVVLGLIALAWARLRGVPFALDSHPGAFGKQGDRVAARLFRCTGTSFAVRMSPSSRPSPGWRSWRSGEAGASYSTRRLVPGRRFRTSCLRTVGDPEHSLSRALPAMSLSRLLWQLAPWSRRLTFS